MVSDLIEKAWLLPTMETQLRERCIKKRRKKNRQWWFLLYTYSLKNIIFVFFFRSNCWTTVETKKKHFSPFPQLLSTINVKLLPRRMCPASWAFSYHCEWRQQGFNCEHIVWLSYLKIPSRCLFFCVFGRDHLLTIYSLDASHDCRSIVHYQGHVMLRNASPDNIR